MDTSRECTSLSNALFKIQPEARLSPAFVWRFCVAQIRKTKCRIYFLQMFDNRPILAQGGRAATSKFQAKVTYTYYRTLAAISQGAGRRRHLGNRRRWADRLPGGCPARCPDHPEEGARMIRGSQHARPSWPTVSCRYSPAWCSAPSARGAGAVGEQASKPADDCIDDEARRHHFCSCLQR